MFAGSSMLPVISKATVAIAALTRVSHSVEVWSNVASEKWMETYQCRCAFWLREYRASTKKIHEQLRIVPNWAILIASLFCAAVSQTKYPDKAGGLALSGFIVARLPGGFIIEVATDLVIELREQRRLADPSVDRSLLAEAELIRLDPASYINELEDQAQWLCSTR
jgi:hypothetical protein